VYSFAEARFPENFDIAVSPYAIGASILDCLSAFFHCLLTTKWLHQQHFSTQRSETEPKREIDKWVGETEQERDRKQQNGEEEHLIADVGSTLALSKADKQ